MKALLISDYGIKHNMGGAQRSNQLIIDYGKELGHEITTFHFDSESSLLDYDYDVVISSNFHAMIQRFPDILDYVADHPRHYRLEHDMNRYLSEGQRKKLFGSTKKTFFLTKYHHQVFVKTYGDIFDNVVYVPDPIDKNEFFDFKRERSDTILYVGFMHHLKGTNNFFEYVMRHPEKNFAMYAWDSNERTYLQTAYSFFNVEVHDPVEYMDMPTIYNQYKQMFYQPEMHEPFCRAVGEALMCGVNVMGNDKIGCLHMYNELGLESFRDSCHTAAKQFWDHIHEI